MSRVSARRSEELDKARLILQGVPAYGSTSKVDTHISLMVAPRPVALRYGTFQIRLLRFASARGRSIMQALIMPMIYLFRVIMPTLLKGRGLSMLSRSGMFLTLPHPCVLLRVRLTMEAQ